MGGTDSDYPATEQAAAHPGSSPRILGRDRARGGGPPCVSCCSRVQDLRSGLDERIAGDGRPVAVEPEDECGRDGHGMDAGGKNCAVANLRRQRTGEVWRGPERSGGVLSIPNQL